MKRSMFAPHGPQLRPQYEQEDEWKEFLERTDTSKVHDFGRYWWTYGRDEDDDGYLREAVFSRCLCGKTWKPSTSGPILAPGT